MINKKIKKLQSSLPKQVENKIKSCTSCTLSSVRRKHALPVIGRGSVPADILFIGEAPGKSEELMNSVFIGPSGKLLDKMISDAKKRIDLSDTITYYITNSVLCRPTDKVMGDNRAPKRNEVFTCMKNVIEIYNIVSPKIVVFVGKVAEQYYKREFRVNTTILHPAYLLRGGGTSHSAYTVQIRKLSEVFLWLQER